MRTTSLVVTFSLAVVSASSAFAQSAGRVLAAAGEVSIVRDGREIPAAANTEVRSGDLLRTGAGSNAQVRLDDSSLIALRQKTEFRLDEFKFAGKEDGTEAGLFTLLKGGFRTVTGLIGRTNRDRYKVTTPTATVGIRGTHFNLVACQGDCPQTKDGLYGGVLDGRIGVSNESQREHQFGAGEYFYVADIRSPAERLISPPDFLRDRLEGQSRGRQQGKIAEAPKDQAPKDQAPGEQAAAPQGGAAFAAPADQPVADAPQIQVAVTEFRAAETLNEAGTPVVVIPAPAPALPSPVNYDNNYPASTDLAFMSAEYDGRGSHNAFNSIPSGMTIATDEQGVRSVLMTGSPTSGYRRDTARLLDGGGDAGVIGWGRWGDGTAWLFGWGAVPLSAEQGFHFVVGELTTSFPESSSLTYSLLGATTPTEARSGALGGWSVTGGSMTANFIQSTLTGDLGLALNRTNEQGTFNMGFTGSASQFASVSGSVTRTGGTADLCATGPCAASGKVLFAGPQATHAGLIYEFNAGLYYVQGAAAFKR